MPVLVLLILQDTARFAVIGDFGLEGPDEAAVALRVREGAPDFIVTVGDNNYPSGAASTIDANIGQYYHDFIHPYTGAYGAGAETRRFFPSLGNHDVMTDGGAPYLDYFELPGNERYYDVVWGPVHLFVIDSNEEEPDGNTEGSTQGSWLQQELATATEPLTVVVMHHSPYSSGPHGSTSALQWPFRAWGADVVISAHDHLYERLQVDGQVYFVNGLGGNGRYTFKDPVPGSQVRYSGDYGAMIVEVAPPRAVFRFVTRDGVVVDECTIDTGTGAIVETAVAEHPPQRTAGGNSDGLLGCGALGGEPVLIIMALLAWRHRRWASAG